MNTARAWPRRGGVDPGTGPARSGGGASTGGDDGVTTGLQWSATGARPALSTVGRGPFHVEVDGPRAGSAGDGDAGDGDVGPGAPALPSTLRLVRSRRAGGEGSTPGRGAHGDHEPPLLVPG